MKARCAPAISNLVKLYLAREKLEQESLCKAQLVEEGKTLE